jgi:hypothetical protein
MAEKNKKSYFNRSKRLRKKMAAFATSFATSRTSGPRLYSALRTKSCCVAKALQIQGEVFVDRRLKVEKGICRRAGLVTQVSLRTGMHRR